MSKDVSLDTKAEVVHVLIVPITMYRCESWRAKEAERGKHEFI